MTQDDHSQDRLYELRIQAETALPKKGFDVPDLSDLSTEEIHKLVHELHVHQIELEMQNEDLGQAHKKLEELKDKYLDLYDFAPVGYVTLNDKGLILEANLTAVQLLGVERTRLLKMFLSSFVCQEFGDTFYMYLQQVFQSQSRQTCEIKLIRKDGTIFYAQLESIAVQDGSGQSNWCRTVLSDITERKRAEQERETLRAQLLQSQKMETTGTLAGGIAHDLNNLLYVVSGYSGVLLQRKHEGDRDYANLQEISQAAKSGAVLVQRLLTLVKKVEPQLRPSNLNHEVLQVQKLVSRTIPKTIKIDVTPQKPRVR